MKIISSFLRLTGKILYIFSWPVMFSACLVFSILIFSLLFLVGALAAFGFITKKLIVD